MGNRDTLHAKLVDLMDGKKVYFQPPESIKLQYPCIIYKLTGASDLYADNTHYRNMKRYDVILVDKNPDSIYCDRLNEIQYSRMDRTYINDNLHHYAFTIYN